MTDQDYILVELRPDQKRLILKYAEFVVSDEVTKNDLKDKGTVVVRFSSGTIYFLKGELSYRLNRCRSRRTLESLDELISLLE